MTTKTLKQAIGWLVTLLVVAAILSPLLPLSNSRGEDEKAAAAQQAKEKQALEKFDKAVELYNQGKYAEARQRLLEVRDSGVELGFFRTRELNSTLQKIDEQMKKAPGAAPAPAAAAPSPAPAPGAPPKPAVKEDFSAVYDKGVALYNAGKYEEAKAVFIRVRDSGDNLGFFKNRNLKNYLAQCDQKIAEASKPKPAPAPKVEKPAPVAKPAPAPAAPKVDYSALYDQGVKLYNDGKYAEAKTIFTRLRDEKADLGFFKNMGLKSYLSKVDAKLAEAAKPKPAPPAPVAKPAPSPAPVAKAEAKPAAAPPAPVAKPAPPAPVAKAEAKPAPAPAPKPAGPSEETVKAMTSLYYKGVALYGQGKYQEAIDALTKVGDSGVGLGWWNDAKLKRYIESARGEIQRSAMAQATEEAQRRKRKRPRRMRSGGRRPARNSPRRLPPRSRRKRPSSAASPQPCPKRASPPDPPPSRNISPQRNCTRRPCISIPKSATKRPAMFSSRSSTRASAWVGGTIAG